VRVSTACGRLASSARPAARRPATSPSKLKTTESVKRTSFCTCSAVHAGAERRDRVLEPGLGEGDDVHVALDDEGVAALADRRARFEEAVELAPLAEDRRLRRVQVFRLAAVEDAAAEADHRPLHRADRKHDAIAEAVVALLARVVARRRPAALVGLGDDQPAFLEQRVVVAREDAGEAAPAVARVAEAEAGGDLAAQASALQVGDRRDRSPSGCADTLRRRGRARRSG
jgi:hypothetical protein